MAVLQMQRISICALKKDRKKILEFLQRQGIIEIQDTLEEDSVFSKIEADKTESILEKSRHEAEKALEILADYKPEKKSMFAMLEGRQEASIEEYDHFSQKVHDIAHIIKKLLTLGKDIAEQKAEISKQELQIELLSPWKSFDIPLNFEGTKNTSAFIGTLPGTWNLEAVYEILSEFLPVNVEIISQSREQTCVFIICEKVFSVQVADKLKSNGFSYPAVSCNIAPAKQVEILQENINHYNDIIQSAVDEIISLADRRSEIMFFSDYQALRMEKYHVMGRLLQSKHVFILTGYIPEKSVELVNKYLSSYDCAIEIEKPSEEEDVPVLLSNNGFNAPLEGVVEAYSLPGKGEVDPTSVSALFYYILFGAMLSDAAYGLILAIGSAVALKKFKTMEASTRKFLTMFFYAGISTTIWGFLYGGFFGDLLKVVSTTFFNKTITLQPLWLDPIANPMTVLVMTMGLGIIHIYLGLATNLYQCIKRKDYKAAVYDVIFWYIILTGCLVLGLSSQMIINMLGLNFILPKTAGTIASYFIILSAIGIIVTNGRESKNPFKRFLKGAYALYNITGYLSDVLSYSRLLALGLATGVICNVVNQIGSMFGGGFVGAILFIIIFLVGNALNIGINALGAYVHSNRLTYVELFGKFYEGGGRKFEPYSAKTNYYKIKEK